MQIENLKLFCDLVETQNFTRAAKRNSITASAVTQMLHHLERDAGEMLILRGSHKFQLTRAGETYYQYASEIVRLYADAVRRVQEVGDTIGGGVELGVCHSILLHQLPPCLKQFQRDFPAVQINVRHGLIDRVHGQVLENTVDLGLVCYPRRLPGLAVDPFRHERLVLVCHPQHPLATRTTVTVPDLKGCQFVAWNEIRWSPFLRNVPNCQRHLFAPHRECDQVEPVKRMVEMDAGVAILPEALVQSEVASQTLVAVPFADGGRTEPLAVIYREQKKLTPAMINFINALKQSVPPAN
jgi:LysR family transcriptional regulator, transcriptional activator of the cysJI operon